MIQDTTRHPATPRRPADSSPGESSQRRNLLHYGPIICQRAESILSSRAGMNKVGCGRNAWRGRVGLWIVLASSLGATGCAQSKRAPASLPQPLVVAVAPVLNLSGSEDFDPLRFTDLIASELQTFDGIAVVPVNLALAELQHRGLHGIETPADARALGAALGADATLVTAVTEYDPYAPPVLGLVMQWYVVRPHAAVSPLDPTAASRAARAPAGSLSERPGDAPQWQVQRVYNAAEQRIQADVQKYAERRGGTRSPYGWRKFLQSQELYVRYCGWTTIQTMLLLEGNGRETREPVEAQS